jgi:TetR/AcrR family transcriptional repressor of nem operon
MRYPAAETAEKHIRILDAASELFRERGFSAVSVAEIMKATGLTHGPFYNHFASKEALVAECLAYTSKKTLDSLGVVPGPDGRAQFAQIYLSEAHRDHAGRGCLMAALATDIGREPAVKGMLTVHLKAMLGKMLALFPGTSKRAARSEAIRMLSALVGALVLARAVDDEELSAEILQQVKDSMA